MNLGLEQKRAVVTAATSGLGRAVATALAGEGASVAICSRSEDRAKSAAADIAGETGATVHGYQADVSDGDSLTAFFDRAATDLGGIDILVCNAGGPPPGSFEKLTEEQWDLAYQLTLQSVVRSVRLTLSHLRQGSGGAILALGSSSVKSPIPNLLLSNVFRPAVHGLCVSLANELATDGIRVNMLSPGRIETERTVQLDKARAEREGVTVEEVRNALLRNIPLGRFGQVEEFGRVGAFLCSDAASYITGSSIIADGGMVKSL